VVKLVKLQYGNERYFLTIPKDIVTKKKWKKGDKFILSFNERGNVELYGVDE